MGAIFPATSRQYLRPDMDLSYYLALEYEDRGRGPRYDCWGLIWLLYARELGIILPRHDEVSHKTSDVGDLEQYIESEAARFTEVDTPQQFDLMVLYQAGYPTHIGMAVNDEEIVHLQEGANVAVEPIYGRRWKNRIYGIYRHEAMR